MSPALNRSTALQRFKHGNTVKIRNGIMFNFYLGLPHLHSPHTALLLSLKITTNGIKLLCIHSLYAKCTSVSAINFPKNQCQWHQISNFITKIMLL